MMTSTTSTEARVWQGLMDPDFAIREEWASGSPLSARHIRFLFEDLRFGSGFVLQRLVQRQDVCFTPAQTDLAFQLFPELLARKPSFSPDDSQWQTLIHSCPEAAVSLMSAQRVSQAQLFAALNAPHAQVRATAVRVSRSMPFRPPSVAFSDTDDVVIALLERLDFQPSDTDVELLTLSLHDRFGVPRGTSYYQTLETQLPFWRGTQSRPTTSSEPVESLDWSLFVRPDERDDF